MIVCTGIKAFERAPWLCAPKALRCGRVHHIARISAFSAGMIASEPIAYSAPEVGECQPGLRTHAPDYEFSSGAPTAALKRVRMAWAGAE